LIALREGEGLPITFSIQVDTVSHKIKRFIEKCGRAGVNRVFLGLESIDPDALKEARKGQNNITEYRAVAQAWHSIGAVTNAGYILGFHNDTPESIARDIEIIKREIPLDVLDFFILTPLPGSQDHKELFEKKVPLEQDLNRYDAFHVTAGHATMSASSWLDIYRRAWDLYAWDLYYTPEHVATVLRRARARGEPLGHLMIKLFVFYACQAVEKVHPLDAGVIGRKYRRDRRPRSADRKRLRVLSTPRAGELAKVFTPGVDLLEVPSNPAACRKGTGQRELQRHGDDAGHGRRTRLARALSRHSRRRDGCDQGAAQARRARSRRCFLKPETTLCSACAAPHAVSLRASSAREFDAKGFGGQRHSRAEKNRALSASS